MDRQWYVRVNGEDGKRKELGPFLEQEAKRVVAEQENYNKGRDCLIFKYRKYK